jgi:type IV secretion system protein VirB3
MYEPVEGFEVPVHKSLIDPPLTAGVPRKIAVVNGTLCAALVLGLQSWYALPVCALLHVAAVTATRHDPQWPELIIRSLRLKNHYRP